MRPKGQHGQRPVKPSGIGILLLVLFSSVSWSHPGSHKEPEWDLVHLRVMNTFFALKTEGSNTPKPRALKAIEVARHLMGSEEAPLATRLMDYEEAIGIVEELEKPRDEVGSLARKYARHVLRVRHQQLRAATSSISPDGNPQK